MKSPALPDPSPALPRRGVLLGLGAAGAAALAAKALPGAGTPAAAAALAPVATAADGYQLTAHVLRYYETTRI